MVHYKKHVTTIMYIQDNESLRHTCNKMKQSKLQDWLNVLFVPWQIRIITKYLFIWYFKIKDNSWYEKCRIFLSNLRRIELIKEYRQIKTNPFCSMSSLRYSSSRIYSFTTFKENFMRVKLLLLKKNAWFLHGAWNVMVPPLLF